MKRIELLQLYNGLNTLGDLPGVDFSYVVAKNIKNLQDEVDAIKKAENPSDQYKEYDKKRVDLAKECADKDENGEPIILDKGTSQERFLVTKTKEFDKKITELQKEYSTAIDDRNKQMEDFDKFLQSSIDIPLLRMKRENLPTDITTKQLFPILPIIED